MKLFLCLILFVAGCTNHDNCQPYAMYAIGDCNGIPPPDGPAWRLADTRGHMVERLRLGGCLYIKAYSKFTYIPNTQSPSEKKGGE